MLWTGLVLSLGAILSITFGLLGLGLVLLTAAMVILIIFSDEDDYWSEDKNNRRL